MEPARRKILVQPVQVSKNWNGNKITGNVFRIFHPYCSIYLHIFKGCITLLHIDIPPRFSIMAQQWVAKKREVTRNENILLFDFNIFDITKSK